VVYRHTTFEVKGLAPQCAIVAVFGYVFTVVLTPITAAWAFGAHLLVVAAVAAWARVAPGHLARRLAIELPFLAFALALPFVVAGERVEVAGLALSRDGLLQAFGLVARATLGVALVIILAATTPVRALLAGLDRLRLPPVIVAVASFMVRYSVVVVEQMQRMRVARLSRGYAPRSLLSARAVALSLGSLFIRSYERGERVHLAMLSRGYTGTLPPSAAGGPAARIHWMVVALFVTVGASIAVAGVLDPFGWKMA
jgi:cobalt/nickel transport system permease protein